MTYQWRRNGTNLTDGGIFSGVHTPNLALAPVSAADVATTGNGYDVVINGTCSPTITSSRAGLTLIAPSNLIWAGDGVTNAWDIALTPNWNANTTTFHNGDAVTFDDPTSSLLINLTNGFLTPSSIIVNGPVWPGIPTHWQSMATCA